MLKIILISTLTIFSSLAYSASFDCKKATTPQEKLICSNPLLDDLDSKMGNEYSQLNKSFPIKDFVRDDQRRWGFTYRKCGDVRTCSEILNNRIKELSRLKSAIVYTDYNEPSLLVTETTIIVSDINPNLKLVRFFGAWLPDGPNDRYPSGGRMCDDEIEFKKKGNLFVNDDSSIKLSDSNLELKGSIMCGRAGIHSGIYKKR